MERHLRDARNKPWEQNLWIDQVEHIADDFAADTDDVGVGGVENVEHDAQVGGFQDRLERNFKHS